MGTADFLLAFDDELQVDRRTALDPLPSLHGEELHDQIPFRVPAPAAPELAVRHRRIERIALPFVQRIDRLDVVVLVHQERGLPLVDDHLAEDHVRAAFRRVFSSLEPVLGQETPDERGGLRLRLLVRGDRRETAVLLQDFKGFVRVGLDARKNIAQDHDFTGARNARFP